MKGESHAIIGASVTFTVFQHLKLEYGLPILGVSIVASILADIDEDDSTINSFMPLHYKKFIYALTAALMTIYMFKTKNYSLLVPAAVTFLIYISSHRGFTHSLAAMLIFSIPIAQQGTIFSAFCFSYGAHLLCDLVNTKGLQLFWPLPGRYRLPMSFSMNSIMGRIIEVCAVLASTAAAFGAQFPVVK